MTDDPIEKAADAIIELINSQPRSPRKEEIMDVLRLHHPHRPEGYLVTQKAIDKAMDDLMPGWVTVTGTTIYSSNSTNSILPLSDGATYTNTVADCDANALSEASLERLIVQLRSYAEVEERPTDLIVLSYCPNTVLGQHKLGPSHYDILRDADIQACECGYKVILQK